MQTIDTVRAKQFQLEGKPIINVLPAEQHDQKHIPGSINIPVMEGDFVRSVENRVTNKEEPVVVYCANTECSASPEAAKLLEDAGFTEVYDFDGGVAAWEEAGLELAGSEVHSHR